MSTSEPKPTRSVPERDREPQRENAQPFPTKFGHPRRRPQPQSKRGDHVRPAARQRDPFEDDGGL